MDDSGGTVLLVGVTFLVIGAVMIGLAIFFLSRTRRFLRTAVDATGTIVDLLESSGSEGGTAYSAVVEFQAADGGPSGGRNRWRATLRSAGRASSS